MTDGATLGHDRLGRGRARVDEQPGRLTIVIPARRNPIILAFFAVWLAIWIVGGVSDASNSSGGGLAGAVVILLLGVVWIGGITAWVLFGRERVDVAGGRLVLARGVGRVRRRRDFDAARVEDLRAVDQTGPFWIGGWDPFGIRGGAIAFDYGARTYRFGGSVDHAEARQLVRRLTEALPT